MRADSDSAEDRQLPAGACHYAIQPFKLCKISVKYRTPVHRHGGVIVQSIPLRTHYNDRHDGVHLLRNSSSGKKGDWNMRMYQERTAGRWEGYGGLLSEEVGVHVCVRWWWHGVA